MTAPTAGPVRSMGYQPALDGLRALSVAVVLLYHAGFTWMHGGFFGVEVFFVVSGFLITSLLLDEHRRSGRVSFGAFWGRRARRLLPALLAVLIAVTVWGALAGSAEQQAQLRRDTPWALLYAANWGQIVGDVPYFSGEPGLLRHLWSLAVEEQWYLVWPVVFVGIMSLGAARRHVAVALGASAIVAFGAMAWLQTGAPAPLGGFDRTNFMYLATVTRVGGLLLGASAAFVWHPWCRRGAPSDTGPDRGSPDRGGLLDVVGAVALAVIGCAAATASITAGYVYSWLLALVSVCSLIAVCVAVDPRAVGIRRLLSWGPLVAVGRRSYGLYLWSWPIFVITGAYHGEVLPFLRAMAITVVVSEASYRLLEMPIRRGALSRWWEGGRRIVVPSVVACGLAVGALAGFYAEVSPFDQFSGGPDATFDAAAATAPGAALVTAPPAGVPPTTVVPTTTLPAAAMLAIVGDSTAHALHVNLPDGIEVVFPAVADGSLDGCGVYDAGRVRSERSFRNDFSMCTGWQDDWADAASGSDVALVVIGAWDVFDVTVDGRTFVFGTPEADLAFSENLRSGIAALLATGTNVGLLEVPCMRPIDVEGAGVPALPERGDDARVAHVNGLLRATARGYDDRVRVIEGPDAWCEDPSIATDVAYRWDGVHVYEPGAKLIMEAITPQVLALAAA